MNMIIGSSLLCSVIILIFRTLISRVNSKEDRFLALKLKFKSNEIDNYKKNYQNRLNRMSIAFILIFTFSFFMDIGLIIIVNFLFLITYFVFIGFLNSKCMKYVIVKYKRVFEEKEAPKFGGIFDKRLYK